MKSIANHIFIIRYLAKRRKNNTIKSKMPIITQTVKFSKCNIGEKVYDPLFEECFILKDFKDDTLYCKSAKTKTKIAFELNAGIELVISKGKSIPMFIKYLMKSNHLQSGDLIEVNIKKL